jgi:hypothetical protein
MGLLDGLGLILFLLGNMAAAMANLYFHAAVTAILATRHPELWRGMDGYSLAARRAFGRFLYSRAAFRLDDPELSKAVIRIWISTAVWLAVLVASSVALAVLAPTSR